MTTLDSADTLHAEWRKHYKLAKRAERRGDTDVAQLHREMCRTYKAELIARGDKRTVEWFGVAA